MLINKLERPKYCFLFILALALTVKIAINLSLVPLKLNPTLLDADEQEYYYLAGDIINGDYEFNSRRTLGYVLAVVIFRLISFDNFTLTQLLPGILFSMTAPLMYLLVRRITDNNLLAVLVGMFIIFWPPYVYYGNSLYSETIALPIFTGLLLLLPRGSVLSEKPEGGWIRWGLSGALLGLCTLIRPMYLLFLPFAVLILLLEERQWLRVVRRAMFLFMGYFLVILPWAIYMTTNAGVPVLVSANGGETIAGGLNPNLIKNGYEVMTAPDGRVTWSGPGKWVYLDKTGYLSEEELKLPYAQQDKLLQQRTFDWIIKNPGSALYLQAAKLLYMWGFHPFRLDKQSLLGGIPTIIALVLSIVSLIRFRQNIRHLSRFWVLPIFVSAVALLSWGSWRFRQPGDLGTITLSLMLLASLLIQNNLIQNGDRNRHLVK